MGGGTWRNWYDPTPACSREGSPAATQRQRPYPANGCRGRRTPHNRPRDRGSQETLMASITKGPAPDCIGELVQEAVEALGYFEKDHIGQLTALFASAWPNGASGQMLLRQDYENLLSDRGRSSPVDAAFNTAMRVVGNAQRQRDIANEPQWGSYVDEVEFFCVPKNACSAALEMNGQKRQRTSRPSIPLAGCDREWCTCGWDHVLS